MEVQIRVEKYENPSVVGFSVSMWNEQLSREEYMKKLSEYDFKSYKIIS